MKYLFEKLLGFYLKHLSRAIPSDLFADKFPVSIKGVLHHNGRLLVVETHTGELDLPGGKLAKGESVQAALVREFLEETGLTVQVCELLNVVNQKLYDKIEVVIVVFRCSIAFEGQQIMVSPEHKRAFWFTEDDGTRLALPPYLSNFAKTAHQFASI